VLDLGKGSVGLIEQTLGCSLTEARALYNGESTIADVSGTNPEPAGEPPRGRVGSRTRAPKNARDERGVSGTNPERSGENGSQVV
jgi:hypothetical protein